MVANGPEGIFRERGNNGNELEEIDGDLLLEIVIIKGMGMR